MTIDVHDNDVSEARHLLKCLDSDLIPVGRLKSFLKKFERKAALGPSAQTKRKSKRDEIEELKTIIQNGIRIRKVK